MPPAVPSVERGLLFGILAAEMNFITRHELAEALRVWTSEGSKPLEQLLSEQTRLESDTRRALEVLVEKHLAQHSTGDTNGQAANGSTAEASADLYVTRAGSRSANQGAAGLRFSVLRPLARGGLGEVFVAEDQELHREVVLKEIQDRYADDPVSRARFLLEAEVTGGLEHPGIAPVYGLGQYPDGRPYYAMRFIRGDSLKDVIESFHRQEGLGRQARQHVVEFRKLLARFLTVCNAMAYAHSRGVLHRDLKPANIILGKFGETLVLDWGLAKPVGAKDISGSGEKPLLPSALSGTAETVVGAAVGTPQYMSPEQAAGRIDVLGPASDVYSLGATLYCLLTGQAPFTDPDMGEVLRAVQRGAFPPPRQIAPDVPRGLEAICLKAMALAPEDRYPSCRTLADDLEHWLADEPVAALPERWGQRAGRWLRHHKTWAKAGVVLLLVVALISSLAVAQVRHALHNERLALGRVEAERDKTDEARTLVAAQLTRARMISGMQQATDEDLLGSLSWFADALQRDQGNAAAEQLQRLRLAAVLRQCPTVAQMWFHDGRVMAAVYDADGSRVATASADFTARIWDTESGVPLTPPLKHTDVVGAIAFSPAGDRLVTASDDNTVRLWDTRTGNLLVGPIKHEGPVRRKSANNDGGILRVRFSPDGQHVISAGDDGTARVWNAASGAAVFTLTHKAYVRHAEYSPDGRRIVTASEDGTARVWDAATGKPFGPPLEHQGIVYHATFSPDSTRVATASADHSGRIWNAATGAAASPPLEHLAPVRFAAFDAAGLRVVTAGEDSRARIWDARSGQIMAASMRHNSLVYAAQFSADGRWIATCSDDNTARVWDTQTGAAMSTPLTHRGSVYAVQFHPKNARLVLTASAGGTARIWEVRTTYAKVALVHEAQVTSAAFSPDGKRLVTASAEGAAQLWDPATGNRLGPQLKHDAFIHRAVFDRQGRRLVTSSADGTARIWDTRTSHLVVPPLPHGGDVRHAEFSPDGCWVVTAAADKTARVWDVVSGKQLVEFKGHANALSWASFNSDGRRVVSTSNDNTAQVWDAVTGKLLAPPLQHSEDVSLALFSPDGSLVVTACNDKTARIWNAETGQPTAPPLRHGSKVTNVSFSPDGKRVLTASDDDTARIWDTATGRPLTPPMVHGGSVRWARFDAAGRRVVTASTDATARVWDAQTGDPLTPPLPHNLCVTDAGFSPDSGLVITAGNDKLAGIWDLTPEPRSVEELTTLAKLLSSGWIDATGGFVPLTQEEQRQAWEELAKARKKRP